MIYLFQEAHITCSGVKSWQQHNLPLTRKAAPLDHILTGSHPQGCTTRSLQQLQAPPMHIPVMRLTKA